MYAHLNPILQGDDYLSSMLNHCNAIKWLFYQVVNNNNAYKHGNKAKS